MLCSVLTAALFVGCVSEKGLDEKDSGEASEKSEEDSNEKTESEPSKEESPSDEPSESKGSKEPEKSPESEDSKEPEDSEESEEPEESEPSEDPEESEKSDKPKDPEPNDRDCSKIQWGSGSSLVEGNIIPRTDAKGFVDKDGDNVIDETETDADMCQLHLSGRKCGFIIYGDTG